MITYYLLLLIFALFGVMLTYKESEYATVAGIIITCSCFIVYLITFILWQSAEIKVKKKQLSKNEDFIKWLKEQEKENKDE